MKCWQEKSFNLVLSSGTENQPEEWLAPVPNEARSWSNRSKTDNSKSEAMGVESNELLLRLIVSLVVASRRTSSISVCKQGGPLVVAVVAVSFKGVGRPALRWWTAAATTFGLLLFEFSSNVDGEDDEQKAGRASGSSQAATKYKTSQHKTNQNRARQTEPKSKLN